MRSRYSNYVLNKSIYICFIESTEVNREYEKVPYGSFSLNLILLIFHFTANDVTLNRHCQY